MSTKAFFCGESFPKRTCNNHLRLKQGWELMDQIQTIIRDKDKIWYMAKGHPKVGWAPIGFAVATPWTNHPQGIVLDFGYRFRVGPYRFCSDGNPMTLSILHFVRYSCDNSFAPALGGACAMGTNTMALIQTCQIQAIMTVPHRLFFSAQLTNCKVGTCWHVELIISQHTQPSPSFFHWENWFSSSSNAFV